MLGQSRCKPLAFYLWCFCCLFVLSMRFQSLSYRYPAAYPVAFWFSCNAAKYCIAVYLLEIFYKMFLSFELVNLCV